MFMLIWIKDKLQKERIFLIKKRRKKKREYSPNDNLEILNSYSATRPKVWWKVYRICRAEELCFTVRPLKEDFRAPDCYLNCFFFLSKRKKENNTVIFILFTQIWRYPSAPLIRQLLWTISLLGRWSTSGSDFFIATKNTITGVGGKRTNEENTWVNSRSIKSIASDLTDKMKRSFFQAAVTSILLYGCTTWTLTKRLEKKLDGNYTRMLRAILNKSWQQHPTRHQLYGHLPPITKTIQVRRTRHAGHCWRSRDELIRDVLLWIPTHGRAKAGRPARTCIQQLCEDTGCCPEDLPRAMNDREEWRERVRDIRATSTIWWWWWTQGAREELCNIAFPCAYVH